MDVKTNLEDNKCNDGLFDAPVNDLQYPPFGEEVDIKKISAHAIGLCSSLNFETTMARFENPIACKKVTETSSKCDKENKEIKHKSVKDSKEFGSDQVRRKKTPKTRFAAEYQASQIPDSKGSTLSIDDLVRFVNGTDLCHGKLQPFNDRYKCDKREKSDVTSKKVVGIKHEKDKSSTMEQPQVATLDCEHDDKHGSDNKTVASVNGTESSHNINLITLNEIDSRGCLVEICLDDDDELFQVVKRKNRNKRLDTKSDGLMALRKNLRGNGNGRTATIYKSDKGISNKLPLRNGTVLVNDKETLNIFIHRLWTEFQSRYHEYIREESTRSSKLEVY